jgi:hypothetical protein
VPLLQATSAAAGGSVLCDKDRVPSEWCLSPIVHQPGRRQSPRCEAAGVLEHRSYSRGSYTEALETKLDSTGRLFVCTSDCLDIFSCLITSADFSLFFPGPRRERYWVLLPRLRDDGVALVFAATNARTRLLSASDGRRLTGLNCISQRRQYSPQPFEERAKLIRIREPDRAYFLWFLPIGLLANDKTTVLRISNENNCMISTADSDLVSFEIPVIGYAKNSQAIFDFPAV